MTLDIIKILLPATLAFFIGIGITPILAHYLYKYKAWKKTSVRRSVDGTDAPISRSLHKDEEKKTPRMGGVLIWGSAFIVTIGVWLLAIIFPTETLTKLDFLTRDQTWIPLFTLVIGGFIGLLDDLLEVTGRGGHLAGGLSLKKRLVLVGLISLFIAWWFFEKLEIASIGIPYYGDLFIGWLFIPLFILVVLAVYAGGVIDGIDGLSGGVFAAAFLAYAGVAFNQDQINLAAFCAVIFGALLAFLWFNIPPARFYMSETGSMGLTITLAVVAFMTDSLGEGHGLIALPFIGFLLFVSGGSSFLQVLSKKFRNGKKIFRVAPVHHHFEAIGWPSYKVTMRYWIIAIIFALIGLVIALIG